MRIGVGDPAGQLARMHPGGSDKRKDRHRLISRLSFHDRKVDGATVEPGRRSGFEASHWKLELAQPRGETERRRVPSPTGLMVRQSDMDESGKKSAGGQHHHAAGKANAELSHHPGNAVSLQQKVIHRLLEQGQVGLVLQPRSNRMLVEETVSLCARRADRGTLGGIQGAKLDPRFVCSDRHGAAQGVHFLDKMPFSNPSNRRIAGHLSQRLDLVS